ncbi:ATP-binding cassette domain-containing protein [Altererythrobacter aerius]|uniref:ATP-binding cassette domain-containing protein n=2 Tax=Tsuneonella aeria TaxID=1837929 RepID=A0A6I4TCH3_9SPHN|nr:ABC transporter ATP-binding protein [Tsuneonella aeria]MXO75031.1 ATP-binding cassette domain-containing protein [Tsuneonella aeria]
MTDVDYSRRGTPLVKDACLTLRPGELTVLVGPNGAGKSTLLRLALGLLAPDRGTVTMHGRPVGTLRPAERARLVAYLPQTRDLAWAQPVRDVVALGRFAYGAAPGLLSQADAAALAEALAQCDLDHLADRPTDTLSGGELGRVHLARALAARTPLILADEPVTALDPRYQHAAMRIFRAAADAGRGVLAVVHDLSLAARYANRIVWMKGGAIVADGAPAETVDAGRLRAVFGIEAEVTASRGGWPLVEVLGPV